MILEGYDGLDLQDSAHCTFSASLRVPTMSLLCVPGVLIYDTLSLIIVPIAARSNLYLYFLSQSYFFVPEPKITL